MAVNKRTLVALKGMVWLACLAPLGWLLYRGFFGSLTANPVEFIALSTGRSTLVLLMATLSITPARKLTGLAWLARFRRLIGLFAFFYACLHFTAYVWLDQSFDIPAIVKDIGKRPFIAAGFFAFLLLIPLAATSSAGAIRRLGVRRWQGLHRVIYLSSASAVLHFWWKVKADTRVPRIFAIVLGILLAYRVVSWGLRKVSLRGEARRNPSSS